MKEIDYEQIPILKIEDFLITSIQVPLHDRLAVKFQRDLLQKIEKTKAKGLVIDITAIDVVDSFITRILVEIAITLVEFGMELEGIMTALNLESGISLLRRVTNETNEERNVG